MAVLNMVQALNQALEQEMARDSDVVVLGEDVGVDGGVFRVTDGLHAKFPNRVFDTPLAESGIVGTAIGMAVHGMRPVAEIQFSGFVFPAMNQLVCHAARLRNRSRGAVHCPMVVRMPSQGGVRALEHHSESVEAYFAHTPGLKVVMPATPYDAKGLLTSAIRDPDPVIFMEPTKLYRSVKEEVPEEQFTVPIGKANIIQEGDDLTVVTWGSYLKEVMDVLTKAEKPSVELIDLRSISPLDTETIISSVKKTGRCLIVQEAPRSFSVSSEISARITERAFLSLKAPVQRLAGYDLIMPMPQGEHLYLVNERRIRTAIEQVMTY
ncbi:alpha-ketoacid dehydrogenase subunit beta [Candidatus Woesearchaeota archaeon]|nr:alpha-ketoacid dehydrogenase subunit beta [Candidatus Woesearchaeota archaeon]